MPSLSEARRSHALCYRRILNTAIQRYRGNDDSKRHGLRLFELEWPNIDAAQTWLGKHALKDDAAAKLFNDYLLRNIYWLYLRHTRETDRHWLNTSQGAFDRFKEKASIIGRDYGFGEDYALIGMERQAFQLYDEALKSVRGGGDPRILSDALGELVVAYAALNHLRLSLNSWARSFNTIAARLMSNPSGLGKIEIGPHIDFSSRWQRASEILNARNVQKLDREPVNLTGCPADWVHRDTRFCETMLVIAREFGDRHGEKRLVRFLKSLRKVDPCRAGFPTELSSEPAGTGPELQDLAEGNKRSVLYLKPVDSPKARIAEELLGAAAEGDLTVDDLRSPPFVPVTVEVSNVRIPAHLGYVLESELPSSASRIVVHIREACCNYGGARNIIEILEWLIGQYGLRLILVEGGEGDVGLSYLRGRASRDRRKHVAEKYLKLGILSPEEYLDLASDYSLMIWGAEDRHLHRLAVDDFIAAEKLTGLLKPIFDSLRRTVETLKIQFSDPVLRELKSKKEAFDEKRLSLADYVEFLFGLAKDHGVTDELYPHCRHFREVSRLERTINSQLASTEQSLLFQQLRDRIDKRTFDALVEVGERIKSGKANEAFHADLGRLAASVGIGLQEYPNLKLYMRSVIERCQIQVVGLSSELDHINGLLRGRVALRDGHTLEISEIEQQLDVIEKFVKRKLSPRDYDRLKAIEFWGSLSQAQLLPQSLPAGSFDGLNEILAAIPLLHRFYELCAQRADVMAEKTIAKLDATKEPLAVLISGGFHAPWITKVLKKRGVGFVAVAPKVEQPTNDRLYKAVIKYKAGQGSFDDVVAAANGTTLPA